MTSPGRPSAVDEQTVSLVGMRFHTRVGVLPHEREIAQPLEVDVAAVRAGAASAYAAGEVLDYRRVYAVVADVAAGPIEWLEDAAEAIATRLLDAESLARVRVAVRKPNVALGGPLAYAEVCVERGAAAGPNASGNSPNDASSAPRAGTAA
ncbi:MAG TPA: dihydroneopterin aldolase [Gemmatirosa sp.]